MDINCNNEDIPICINEYDECIVCEKNKDCIINNDIEIKDTSNMYKKIIFRNLNTSKDLNIIMNYSKIDLENIKAENVNIIGFNNTIEIKNYNCINNINICNKSNTKLKATGKGFCINNINIKKVDTISDPCIFLLGNFKSCNIQILTSTNLYCKDFCCYNPIKINIENSCKKQICVLGDYSNGKVEVINCTSIIGSCLYPPKNLNITVPFESKCEKLNLEGNLSSCNIKIKKSLLLKIYCLCLKKLLIYPRAKVKIVFCQNSNIIFLGIKGKVILTGNYQGVVNALKHAIFLKSTAILCLDEDDILFDYIRPLVKCINKALLYFIEEKNKNITIGEIEEFCNCNDLDVDLEIEDLIPLECDSNIFTLNEEKNKLIYTPEIADSCRIDLNKVILMIKFCHKDLSFCKPVILSGKYLNLQINYEDDYCIIKNYANVVKYAFTQKYVSNIILDENITCKKLKLNLRNRNIKLNLNNKSFLLNHIKIVDSKVLIENGELIPSPKIKSWNNTKLKDNNLRSFIQVKNKKRYSKLYCDNIKIKNPILDFSCLYDTPNVALFFIKNKYELCKSVEFYLNNCSLELKNQNSNKEHYVIYTFAPTNIIYNNNFNQSNNCIKINGLARCNFTKLILSENNFTKVIDKDNNVLTMIPYSKSKGISVNNQLIVPNLNKENLKSTLKKVGLALISNIGHIKSNYFGDGSRLTLWSNENKAIVEHLVFNNNWWGVLEPPILFPQLTNNDMEHTICITFHPNNKWVDNIVKIKVINSKESILSSSQFTIDKNLGKIYIYNVIPNNLNIPIYQGILEPSNNKIIIYSKDYKNAEVIQPIKAIQIVEFKNGIGKAITRIETSGTNEIQANLISNIGKTEIGKGIDVDIYNK